MSIIQDARPIYPRVVFYVGEKNLGNPNKRNRDGSKLYLHSFQAHPQPTEAGVRVAYCACPSS